MKKPIKIGDIVALTYVNGLILVLILKVLNKRNDYYLVFNFRKIKCEQRRLIEEDKVISSVRDNYGN